ncbi:MAG: hypothetical protein ACI8WB_004537, partial [Phenylobacterium sp.]
MKQLLIKTAAFTLLTLTTGMAAATEYTRYSNPYARLVCTTPSTCGTY